MSDGDFLLSVLVWSAFLGLIPAIIASSKGHNFFLWWLFGAALFIVALPMAIVQKPRYLQLPPQTTGTKKCPFCAEVIKDEAIVCRFCGRDMPQLAEPPPTEPREGVSGQQSPASSVSEVPLGVAAASATSGRRSWVGIIMLAVVVIFVGIAVLTNRTSDVPRRSTSNRTSRTETTKRYVYAKSAVNIRSGPGTGHSVVRTASSGERLEYAAKDGSWYRLRDGDPSQESWIHESVVLTQTQKERRDKAKLKLVDWTWGDYGHGYVKAAGRVTNVSSERLEHVQAVATFQDASGAFISTETALVEFDPLMPGQTSNWEVMGTWNPRMQTAYVEFKHLMGGKIDTYRE